LPEETADTQDPPEHHNDPPDTPLGMLQRGRGAGYLWALQQDPRTLHPLLVECITHDPRLSEQSEQRADYYARLALFARPDLAPLSHYLRTTPHERVGWEVTLTIETLGRLALMGNAEAASILSDYVAYGAQWDFALRQLADLPQIEDAGDLARVVCGRFKTGEEMDDAAAYGLLGPYALDTLWEKWTPRYPCIARLIEELHHIEEERERNRTPWPPDYTNVPVAALLEQVDAYSRMIALKAAISKVQPEDKDVCIRAFETANPFAWRIAFECLSALGMAELVYDTALEKSVEQLRLLESSGEQIGMQSLKRRAITAILEALPPNMTLPYARRWFNSPDWNLARTANDLLKEHGTMKDFPIVRAVLLDMLRENPDVMNADYEVCSLLKLLARFREIGPLSEVEKIFVETDWSFARQCAARAMAANAPDWFAHGYAFECLWDAEERIRVIGCENVALDVPGAAERLRALADDPFEEESVRDAARERAPGA
jgi:hypothetical protein